MASLPKKSTECSISLNIAAAGFTGSRDHNRGGERACVMQYWPFLLRQRLQLVVLPCRHSAWSLASRRRSGIEVHCNSKSQVHMTPPVTRTGSLGRLKRAPASSAIAAAAAHPAIRSSSRAHTPAIMAALKLCRSDQAHHRLRL